MRAGGFGPFFSGALLLSLLILALMAWKYRDVLKDNVFLLLLASLVIVSGFTNPEMWWARFVPQFWAIPAIIGLIGLRCLSRGRLYPVVVALFLTLLANNLLITAVYLRASHYQDQLVAIHLTQLRRNAEPLTVDFKGFVARVIVFNRKTFNSLKSALYHVTKAKEPKSLSPKRSFANVLERNHT